MYMYIAASKLLFTRAISAMNSKETGALEKVRCELRAAQSLIWKSQDRIRQLEEEVKSLRAKEILLRASRAERTSPPPHFIPTFLSGGEHMGVEESSGVSPPRVAPPPRGSPSIGALLADTPRRLKLSSTVEQVLRRMLPPREAPGQPLTSPQVEPWSKVVGRKARKKAAAKPPMKETISSSSSPVKGKGRKRKKKKKDPTKQGS